MNTIIAQPLQIISFDVSQPLSFSSMPDFEGLTIASLMDLSFGPSARRSMNEEMRVVKQRFLRSLSGTTGVINSIHQSLTMGEMKRRSSSSIGKSSVGNSVVMAVHDEYSGAGPPGVADRKGNSGRFPYTIGRCPVA